MALTKTAPQLPETQTAIVADGSGNLIVSQHVPLPALEPDMLLVKTVAVALNPSDAKFTGAMAAEGATAGSDCAGIVVGIGSAVKSAGRFSIGDRVCAPLAPMDPLAPRSGAFANYAAVAADLALKVPGDMPLESAAGLGTSLTTIGCALFRSLSIPGHPDRLSTKPAVVLVYGGSSATGTMAIQLIRRSGCIPIATCSPHNFALVKSYGAAEAFDYRDPSSVDSIKAYTGNALDFALDCVCQGSSMKFCYAAIGRAGGRYTTLEPFPQNMHTRKRVKPDWLLGAALLGREIGWKEPYRVEADPELRQFGRDWVLCAQRLLDCGDIKPHPARVGREVGLEPVLEGIELLRQKAVSGEKLVYRIAKEQ
ncbi:chaperonin 10-like protein [Lasiosphaeria miniovina]|uniref:Chaperonin 10-like protein n=1 Tax=Lasiosphaeria miniovina TaxID=1954250 RepID=A0AA40EC82_9PEZI|nr:chaperonin 10-like protein [Lasiosphaeria miniovina]KAK0732952.1 chaperonin 10-like protein [Lasiosphaeria miniovina]